MSDISLSDYIKEKMEEKPKKKYFLKRKTGKVDLPKGTKTKVFNVPDSSKYKEPEGDTCIGYWEKATGFEIKEDTVYRCPACDQPMSKKDSTLDGAHVYKPSDANKWYFVPLCSKCNNPENTDEMEVDTVLVPVPSECYEKKPEK